MRFRPETLVVLLIAGRAFPGAAQDPQPGGAPPSASPSPTPSPAAPPRYKLIPYGFESAKDRPTAPLLRFEDKTEVLGIEMNAAIARFFDKDGNGDMMRGATPGGAPSLAEMKNYRPHMSPSIDFLSLAMWAANLGKGAISRRYKSRVERNEELLRALLLGEHPTPAPTPAPSPSPSPSPSPTASPTPRPSSR
jgi:hypothetical protein